MADSRSLSFGVQFGTDTAPLDELNEKQRKVQEEAERTADKLEQSGTSLTDVGTRATAAFNNVSGAGTKMGTSVRSAMLEQIRAEQAAEHDDPIRAMFRRMGEELERKTNDTEQRVIVTVRRVRQI